MDLVLKGFQRENIFQFLRTFSIPIGIMILIAMMVIPLSPLLLDGASITFPTLTATGYAVVSTQPGQSIEQRRLMAIRAARMSAMRELAEQIHGLKVDSNTTVIDLMVQNDTFRGIVSGVIRGARTVRINPTGSDTYETVLEIDQDMVAYLFRQAQTL